MLSERVDAVLPASSTFLRLYAEYVSQCCDAPDLFHVGVGLTVFAGAIAKKVSVPFLAGRTLIPNLYTLLVGPSRSARKTASMDAGLSILQSANPEAIIPVPGSYEELITQLRTTPSGLLTFREFSHFLKTTQRGYGEPIRTVLMDLYDWPANRAYTRNLRKGKTIIEPPIVVSSLGAVSNDLLFRYCVDEQTEMLTATGWKHHQDVAVGEMCYTLNHATGLGEWQPVSAINVFPGQPGAPMVRMEGRNHSSLTTPNHRWPVRAKGNSSWTRRWRTSETLNQSDHILCAARDSGLPTTPQVSDAFVELVAWIWTEGSWNVSNALSICQSHRVNAVNCARIRAALSAHLGPATTGSMWPRRHDDVPLWVEDSQDYHHGMTVWRLNQAASRAFTEVVSIPEKVVSLSWLRTLTQAQLELFIDISMRGDGHIERNRLAQASKDRADAFAFACILAGKPVSYCTLNNDHNRMWEIGVLKRAQFSPVQHHLNADDRPWRIERTTHDGPVWCPTTPNGTWLARRNGSVYWTGNTDTEEWTGGFMARMVLLYGERGNFRMPSVWPEAEQYLGGVLRQWMQAGIPSCGGFSPDAWSVFTQWSQYKDSETHHAPLRVVTHISGATTLAAKIALLFAVDCGEPHAGPGWLITQRTMLHAIEFVDKLYLPSVFALGDKITIGPWERDRQRVLDAIDRAGTNGLMYRDGLRSVKMSSTLFQDVVNTLREEGTIVQVNDARGPVLKRPQAGTVLSFPGNRGANSGSNTGSGQP